MNILGKNHKCCILCLRSPIKVPGLTLHQFPTSEEKRNVWLNACGLEADEYLPYRKLCSRHFDEACYNKSGFRLKLDAIPTKKLKGKIIRPFFQQSEDKTIDLALKNDELTVQPPTSETVNVSSENNESTTQTVLSLPSTPELQETPKKEKRFEGELKTPDFATPQRSRKSWNLAKTQIKIQQNKIKMLNQKVRRLQKKLSSLKLLMGHLKQKNLLRGP